MEGILSSSFFLLILLEISYAVGALEIIQSHFGLNLSKLGALDLDSFLQKKQLFYLEKSRRSEILDSYAKGAPPPPNLMNINENFQRNFFLSEYCLIVHIKAKVIINISTLTFIFNYPYETCIIFYSESNQGTQVIRMIPDFSNESK